MLHLLTAGALPRHSSAPETQSYHHDACRPQHLHQPQQPDRHCPPPSTVTVTITVTVTEAPAACEDDVAWSRNNRRKWQNCGGFAQKTRHRCWLFGWSPAESRSRASDACSAACGACLKEAEGNRACMLYGIKVFISILYFCSVQLRCTFFFFY